jgi:hypothetical protein
VLKKALLLKASGEPAHEHGTLRIATGHLLKVLAGQKFIIEIPARLPLAADWARVCFSPVRKRGYLCEEATSSPIRFGLFAGRR